MTLRLSDLVLRGELYNTSRYTVHGWLLLRGWEKPMMLQLTGDCDADLRGRHIRFVSRREPLASGDAGAEQPGIDLSNVAWQQIGPTGTMTASRKVKIADCSPVELYQRIKLDEPPPMRWVRCLTLEWFSQNGRVLVELPDPELEFVASEDDAPPAESSDAEAPVDDEESTPGLGVTCIELNDDGEADIRHEFHSEWDEEDGDGSEDPYGLFPEDLKRQFDTDAMDVDRLIDDGDSDSDSRALREMELMDELIERGEGEPIGTLFERTVKLPAPGDVSDEQVEAVLKSLLAELALFGIALDICEHFTPRDAYRLLVEEICKEQHAYRELRNTQWVQHFMTAEFCEKCEAELEREMEECDRRREQDSSGDDGGDDEMPY